MSQSRRGWGGWGRGFLPGQPALPRRATGARGEAARPGTCQGPEAESAHCSSREGLAPFIQAPEQRTIRFPLTLVTPSARSEAWRRFPFLRGDPTTTFAMSRGSPAQLRSYPPHAMHIPAFPDRGRVEAAGGPQADERKRKTEPQWTWIEEGRTSGLPELGPPPCPGTADGLAATASLPV